MKGSAGDDPEMDASDLNDEEIEVSAFCTIFALSFALPILNTATSID